MRFHQAPRPLLHLLTTILLTPRPILAGPHPAVSAQAGFDFNELFARWECSGQYCGYSSQLCCQQGGCYTDANDEAQCASSSGAAYSSYYAAASSAAVGGHWEKYTTIYTVTDKETVTSVYSTYIPGRRCNYALNEQRCGDNCCAGNQYCSSATCVAAAATQTTKKTVTGAAATPGAPLRPTSRGFNTVTETASHTTTRGFIEPVPTGANVTMTEQKHHHGLSGGAIAGIVIGVLVGLFILGLICFYCCLWGLLDGCLALFGMRGRRDRRRVTVEEYERRGHHSSDDRRGRTWWGARRPARVERRTDSHGKEVLGVGAGLAGLWALLGLKRQRDRRRNDEKYSEYSYSSDYYTSASSASTDDRRTRHTHRSVSRSRR